MQHSSAQSRIRTVAFWAADFLLPIALLLILTAWSGVYPFGGESFLTEDLKFQYIDFFTWYQSVLSGEGSLFYAPQQALGNNAWGLVSYYLSSPFNLLIVFFDQDSLTAFAYLISALKLGCIQLAMTLFLRKRFSLERMPAMVLALCFTWCCWTATQLRNPEWMDVLILLPLTAWGTYALVRSGKWKLLLISVASAIITCWYTAYMLVVFLVPYFVLELMLAKWGDGSPGAWCSQHLGKCLVRFALVMAGALALSAFTFLPTVLAMMQKVDPGLVLNTFEYDAATTSSVLTTCTFGKLVKAFFPGMWVYDLSPQVYCGVLVLLLCVLFVFVPRHIPAKVRIVCVVFAGVLLLGFWLMPLYTAWCGFRVPNGFYCRTSFFLSFFMVWMASMFFARVIAPSKRWERMRPAVRAVIYAVALVWVFAELLFSAHAAWLQIYKNYPQDAHNAYVASARAQHEQVANIEGDTNDYRMAKSYTRAGTAALNEGMSVGYNEISSYSSASNADAIAFLNDMGYSREGEVSVRYSNPILATDSLLGVKYVDTAFSAPGMETVGVGNGKNTTLYENPYALSLGYGVSNDVVSPDFVHTSNPFERQNALIAAMLGSESGSYVRCEASEVRSEDGTQVTWEVTVPSNAIGYAYVIPVDYTSYAISVNGSKPQYQNTRWQDSFVVLNDANAESATVEVKLTCENPEIAVSPDVTCAFYALDMDKFEDAISLLSQNQMEFSVFEPGHIEGVYIQPEASSDASTFTPQTLLLTIPNAPGWSVTVNGTQVQSEDAAYGALMSIPVEPGENHITMNFVPPGLVAGCAVSAATLVVLVLICIISGRNSRRQESSHQKPKGKHRAH